MDKAIIDLEKYIIYLDALKADLQKDIDTLKSKATECPRMICKVLDYQK